MTNYLQCRLVCDSGETIAWIESRGAKLNAMVELKSADGTFWRVAAVYGFELDEAALRQKQANDRGSLPSLVGAR